MRILFSAAILLIWIQCKESYPNHEAGLHAPPDTLVMHKVMIGKDSTALYLPDDLDAQLWAESPMLFNPTNMDVDYKGRIWITEAVNYRDFNPHSPNRLHHQQGDRVMILEDVNQDGIADTSRLFVQDTDLVAPLGIAVIGKKIIVSCAPNLIIYTDENEDDIPDHKEIVLSGFGGLDHDHSLHSLVAGPDGQWYFNTGNAGPHNVTDKSGWTLRSGSMYTGGTPYNKKNEGNQKSDDGRVWVGGLSLRMNKEIKDLKVMAHNFRNSYEITVDSYGNLWQNDNDDQVMACRTSYLMEGGNAGFFSKDGTRSWQGDRRPWQDIFTAHWHQSDPGVMPVSDNAGAGSPTGMTINEGNALGDRYNGMVLSAEAGRNVIYAYWPQANGSGYTMKRHNLVSTLSVDNVNYQWNNDISDRRMWFRPSDVCIGTDGAMYIADWYDPIVGGHAMHDTIGYGRIIRISPKNKQVKAPKIDINSDAGKLMAIKSPAINVRNLGYEAIKGSSNAKDLIHTLLNETDAYVKSRAVYILSAMEPDQCLQFLSDKNENIRIAAFRALKNKSEYLMQAIDTLLKSPRPAILREIAISIRDIPYEKSKPILEYLIKNYPGNDIWYDAAFAIACDGKEEKVYHDFLGEKTKAKHWSDTLCSQLFTLHTPSSISALHTQLQHQPFNARQKEKLITAIAFINDTNAVKSMISLSQSKDSMIRSHAFWWINFRRTNDWASLFDWTKINTDLTEDQKTLIKNQDIVLGKGSETEKINAGVALATSAEGGKILLSLASNDKISGKLRDTISKIIINNPDASVRAMASDLYWRRTEKKSHQYSIELISKMQPHMDNGKIKFESACATCHRKNTIGKDIGPDLSTIGQKMDARTMIDAIINPAANIAFGYELTTFKTKDKNYFGFLVGDGSTISIKDISGVVHSIEKSKLLEKKVSAVSLMPPAHQLNLSDRDVADIVGYLRK